MELDTQGQQPSPAPPKSREYTVRDESTGRTITFAWDAPGDPTDADLAEVFSAAGSESPRAVPEMGHAKVGRAVMRTLGNVPGSAANLLGGLYETVRHPVETAKNLGRVGLGAAEKLVPGEQGHEPYADAVGEFYKSRYGGLSKIANTVMDDPIGALADVSTVAGGGLSVARAAGVPTRVIQGLRKIEAATNPAGIARGLTRATANTGARAERTAISLKERGLKPKESDLRRMPRFGDSLPERSRGVAQRLLEERIPTSRRGSEQLQGKIDDLHGQVNELLAGSTAQARTAPLVDEIGNTRATFERQLVPADDLAAVDHTMSDLLQNDALAEARMVPQSVPTGILDATGQPVMRTTQVPDGRILRGVVPVQDMNAMKRGTYQRLGPKQYGGELKSAGIEAEKALARGARRSVEDAVPEVGPLNARESELIDLSNILDDSVARAAKNNAVQWSDVFVASHSPMLGAANWVSRHPGASSPLVQGAFDAGRFGQRIGAKGERALGPGAQSIGEGLRAAILARMATEEPDPSMVLGGFHIETGARVPGTPRADLDELIRLGWDAATAAELAKRPEPAGARR